MITCPSWHFKFLMVLQSNHNDWLIQWLATWLFSNFVDYIINFWPGDWWVIGEKGKSFWLSGKKNASSWIFGLLSKYSCLQWLSGHLVSAWKPGGKLWRTISTARFLDCVWWITDCTLVLTVPHWIYAHHWACHKVYHWGQVEKKRETP